MDFFIPFCFITNYCPHSVTYCVAKNSATHLCTYRQHSQVIADYPHTYRTLPRQTKFTFSLIIRLIDLSQWIILKIA